MLYNAQDAAAKAGAKTIRRRVSIITTPVELDNKNLEQNNVYFYS